jgi:hypothetical protein
MDSRRCSRSPTPPWPTSRSPPRHCRRTRGPWLERLAKGIEATSGIPKLGDTDGDPWHERRAAGYLGGRHIPARYERVVPPRRATSPLSPTSQDAEECRSPDYESGGQEFESLRARQIATIENKTANLNRRIAADLRDAPELIAVKGQRMCSSPLGRGRRPKAWSHAYVIQSARAGRETARPSSL